MKNNFLILALLATGFTACNNNNSDGRPRLSKEEMAARMDSLRTDLLKTDLAFSELSEQKGRNQAFISYAAENATFLRPYSMPVTGKDTITNLFNSHPDSAYTLTWVPIRADVGRSGDLGFTYGTYSLNIKNIGHEEGTYCTVWKKDKEHNWKFVLDTGNEGLKSDEVATDKAIKAEVKKEQKAGGKKTK
jgi:ketosteroid isomerase-like protein